MHVRWNSDRASAVPDGQQNTQTLLMVLFYGLSAQFERADPLDGPHCRVGKTMLQVAVQQRCTLRSMSASVKQCDAHLIELQPGLPAAALAKLCVLSQATLLDQVCPAHASSCTRCQGTADAAELHLCIVKHVLHARKQAARPSLQQ
jgi:selenocysteine-specific translation elongation factor